MPNKQYAEEWLEIAYHHLESAKTLLEADHFTDIIGLELHQAIEKICKSVYAYEKKKIEKTHDLILLINDINQAFHPTEKDLDIIEVANDYYSENKYPAQDT